MRSSACFLALGLLAFCGRAGAAHEPGVLHLAAREVGVGGEISVHGQKLPRRTRLRLELRGALATLDLGTVHTDGAGEFTARLPLADSVRPGTYGLLAIAPDGDVSARADLVVLAAAPAGEHVHGAQEDAARGRVPQARAEMMDLPASRSAGEWVVILGIIGLSVGCGVVLLRGARQP
ncbi:MAG: hypothetical protein HY703_09870 [Gemmatimonadetes bacterium]|nr:hypothetical protein [Gemmatimonadota bacterium]